MGGRRVTIIIASALLAFAVVPPAGGAPVLRLTPDRLGPITFGTTLEQASSELGDTLEAEPSVNGCVYFGLPGPLRYSATLLASRGVELDLIIVGRRGIQTSRGIRVGDSLRRLRHKYRRRLAVAPRGYDLSGATTFYWVHSTVNAGYVLRFGLYRGRVTEMTAGRRALVVDFGECA